MTEGNHPRDPDPGRDRSWRHGNGAVRAPLFEDRHDAGRSLARRLIHLSGAGVQVYGVARGGVPVAAEVARILRAPLDAIAVCAIGHPHHPDLTLGMVAAGGPPALDPRQGWISIDAAESLDALVADAEQDAKELDAALHRLVTPLSPAGAVCVLVADTLIRSAPLVAACRWARKHHATRIAAAAPVGTPESVRDLEEECAEVVVPVVRRDLSEVSIWRRNPARVSTAALAELVTVFRNPRADEPAAP